MCFCVFKYMHTCGYVADPLRATAKVFLLKDIDHTFPSFPDSNNHTENILVAALFFFLLAQTSY